MAGRGGEGGGFFVLSLPSRSVSPLIGGVTSGSSRAKASLSLSKCM